MGWVEEEEEEEAAADALAGPLLSPQQRASIRSRSASSAGVGLTPPVSA